MSIKYINYKKKYLEIKGGSFFNFFCPSGFCSPDFCSNEQDNDCQNSASQYITPQNITYQENIPPQEPIPQDNVCDNSTPQEPIPQDNVCDNSTPQEPIHQEYIKLNTLNKHDGKVFALSDIHGDLHSLIISLRDCAKVIGKHGYNNGENNEVVDPEIELNLLIDICTEDNDFDETFGYEWIGGNSYIVICGDIIDPKRSEIDPPTNSNYCIKNNPISSNKIPCLDYPQIEIKILRFINAINEQAFINGGRIIKLLGNHEIESIKKNNNQFINKYSFTNSGREYYRGTTRYEIFNFGNEGFKLLLKYDCKILIIINNTIFVHGQIPNPRIYNFKDIIKDNHIINNTLLYNIGDKDYDKYKDAWNIIIPKYNHSASPLQLRNWASFNDYNDRNTNTNKINRNTNKINIQQEDFCNQEVITTLEDFFEKKGNIINKIRVVIGHCVQSDFTIKSTQIPTTTFTHLKDNDRASKTYSIDDIYFGKANFNDQNKIFGITMQCPKMDNKNKVKDFFIYHIDVGSSRGFDKHNHLISDIPDENKYLFSRNPQVLSIHNEEVLIIKSKMKNTRIHLPRPSYEDLIESDSDKRSKLNFTVSPSNYDKKYLPIH